MTAGFYGLKLPDRPRTMRDPAVREQRLLCRMEPHVRPLNQLVDEIERERRVRNLPYIDPTFGGIHASVLLMLKAPEADANPVLAGRRFLSLDNDDPVAARIFSTCREVGLDRSELVAWNTCPFPIADARPSDEELRAAAPYTWDFVDWLAGLKVVVLLGAPARDSWRKYGPPVGSRVKVLTGASPSPPGINRPGNLESYEAAMRRAAEIVHGR